MGCWLGTTLAGGGVRPLLAAGDRVRLRTVSRGPSLGLLGGEGDRLPLLGGDLRYLGGERPRRLGGLGGLHTRAGFEGFCWGSRASGQGSSVRRQLLMVEPTCC